MHLNILTTTGPPGTHHSQAGRTPTAKYRVEQKKHNCRQIKHDPVHSRAINSANFRTADLLPYCIKRRQPRHEGGCVSLLPCGARKSLPPTTTTTTTALYAINTTAAVCLLQAALPLSSTERTLRGASLLRPPPLSSSAPKRALVLV